MYQLTMYVKIFMGLHWIYDMRLFLYIAKLVTFYAGCTE